jgi:hypothetical protein
VQDRNEGIVHYLSVPTGSEGPSLGILLLYPDLSRRTENKYINHLGQRATNQHQGNLIQRFEDGPEGCWPLEGSAVIPIFHDRSTGSEANQHTSGNGSNRVAIYS